MAVPESFVNVVLSKPFKGYFRIVEIVLRQAGQLLGMDISISIDAITKKPIDVRLTKIEDARANLQEALSALDELSNEAERNKAELDQAIKQLDRARLERASEAEQLSQIKNIAQADVEAFRRIAGIDPLRERFIGFFAGIIASLIAAGIWQIGLAIIRR